MLAAIAVLSLLGPANPAAAEALPEVLVRVYQNNPQLNAERAKLRATDESVPQALVGYRPQLVATLSAGLLAVRNLMPGGDVQSATIRPWSAGLTLNQTIFNGFKTANMVRQAESQIRSGREGLRNSEQLVLLDAVTAYMGVLSNQALVEAQRANVTFLRETLDTTRKRLDAGDVTPTDVAQGEARYSRGIADLNSAEVNLAVSQAMFLQVVGTPPGRLAAASPVDRFLPRTREESQSLAQRENPAVLAASYDLDASQSAVHIAEAGKSPVVTLQGSASRSSETDSTLGTSRTDMASVIGQMTVPIYDGGMAASQTRQAKELVAQSRQMLDRTRLQVQNAVAAAWVTSEGSRVAISAAEAELRAARLALEGVQREALAGQRTTLDVLNSQQDLMSSRARLIQAQRDRVIASYTLLGAIGRLDHRQLGLNTPDYDPMVHYQQVRDAWDGLRTPSGQ